MCTDLLICDKILYFNCKIGITPALLPHRGEGHGKSLHCSQMRPRFWHLPSLWLTKADKTSPFSYRYRREGEESGGGAQDADPLLVWTVCPSTLPWLHSRYSSDTASSHSFWAEGKPAHWGPSLTTLKTKADGILIRRRSKTLEQKTHLLLGCKWGCTYSTYLRNPMCF